MNRMKTLETSKASLGLAPMLEEWFGIKPLPNARFPNSVDERFNSLIVSTMSDLMSVCMAPLASLKEAVALFRFAHSDILS